MNSDEEDSFVEGLEGHETDQLSPSESEESHESAQTGRKKAVEKRSKLKVDPESSTTPGIIYLSTIPPFMRPHKVRHLLSPYGTVGRIYLQPEDTMVRQRRIKFGGNKKLKFTEGWVEFEDKRVAKAVARALNSTPVARKKRSMYHDDLWNIKYLPKFRWTHLTEKIAYNQAVREQKMRTEISQAKRETAQYIASVEKHKEIEAIVKRRRKRGATEEETTGSLQRRFKQRKVKETATDLKQSSYKTQRQKSPSSSTSGTPQRSIAKGRLSDSLLKKIFA